jgi:hypothetical protein
MSKGKWLMVLAGCLVCGIGWGEASGLRFQAALNGAKVVPGPVQTAMRGKARFTFAGNLSRMAYRLQIRNGAAVLGARLHCAPVDAAGPVIAELLGPVSGGWNGPLDIAATLTGANLTDGEDCAAAIGKPMTDLADLAGAMADGLVYVDVVSEQFPEGAIRGQTAAVLASSSATPASQPTAGHRGPKIIVSSTPFLPSVFAGTVAVPLRLGAPFPNAGIPGGVAAVTITGGIIRIPISVLGTPSPAFPSTGLAVNVPDIALSVPGANFTLPQFSLGLPESSFTFEPTMNPPFPTTTFAIPATVVSFPAVIQPVAAGFTVPATATLSFPAMSFSPQAPFPGSLAGTLVISTF